MKLIFHVIYLLALALLISCNQTLHDVDGNTYDKVRIGEQIWMTENLKVTHFRNGDEIPWARTTEDWVTLGKQGKPAWCYPDGNEEYNSRHGKLYNWYAISDPRGIAPAGWHITSDDEWTAMIDLLGGSIRSALILRIDNSLDDKTSKASFNGMPAGCRNGNGTFYGSGSFAYWWSSTSNDSTTAWMRILNYPKCDIVFIANNKIYGASVRCIKD